MGLTSTNAIVLDGKDHLLGRLASIVAKNLLNGQKVVVVRCDELVISGNFHRSKLKYLAFLRKRCNINPRRGAFHFRAPSRIFWRVIRGMLPHKTDRGKRALTKLKVFDGCPPPYDATTRKVAPKALRHVCLKPRRKVSSSFVALILLQFCQLARLSTEMGWKYEGIVNKLEGKRKVKSTVYFDRKKKTEALRKKAVASVAAKIAPYQKIIEQYGFN